MNVLEGQRLKLLTQGSLISLLGLNVDIPSFHGVVYKILHTNGLKMGQILLIFMENGTF